MKERRKKEANFLLLSLANMSNGVIHSKLEFKTTKSLNHPFNHKVECLLLTHCSYVKIQYIWHPVLFSAVWPSGMGRKQVDCTCVEYQKVENLGGRCLGHISLRVASVPPTHACWEQFVWAAGERRPNRYAPVSMWEHNIVDVEIYCILACLLCC